MMGHVTMSVKKLDRVQLMTRLAERRLTQRRAAELAALTERHVRRLYGAVGTRLTCARASKACFLCTSMVNAGQRRDFLARVCVVVRTRRGAGIGCSRVDALEAGLCACIASGGARRMVRVASGRG